MVASLHSLALPHAARQRVPIGAAGRAVVDDVRPGCGAAGVEGGDTDVSQVPGGNIAEELDQLVGGFKGWLKTLPGCCQAAAAARGAAA